MARGERGIHEHFLAKSHKIRQIVLALFLLTTVSLAACTTPEPEQPPTDTPGPTTPSLVAFDAGEVKCVQFDGLTLGTLTSPLVLDWLTVTPVSGTLRAVDELPAGGDGDSELAIQTGLVFTHSRASSVRLRTAHFNTPVQMESFSLTGQHVQTVGTTSQQYVVHQLETGGAAITRTEVSTEEREGVVVEYCATLLLRGWRYETNLEGLVPVAMKGWQNTLGGILIAGSLLERPDRVWVLRADHTGSPEWFKTYRGIHTISLRHEFLLPTPGGGAVMIGRANTPDGDCCVLGVVKINPRGEIELTQGFELYRPSLETGVVTSDGGFAVIASTDFDSVWLGKLDPQGDLEWDKEYTIGDPGQLSVFEMGIDQTADDGYVIAGRTAWYLDQDPGQVWVLRVDADGEILWQKNFGGFEQDGADSVIETSDGNIIVAGFTTSFGPDAAPMKQYFLVLILDPDGNLLQSWAYGSSDAGQASMAFLVEETDTGELLVSGEQIPGPDNLVTMLNANGILQWGKVYKNDAISSAQFRSAGGGETIAFGNGCDRTILVAWLDQMGGTDPSCLAEVATSISAYPAPVTWTDTTAIAQEGGAVAVPIEVFVADETATQIGCGC